MNKEKKDENSDVKFSEKFSIKFRKTIIVSRLFTILTVIILVAAFIGLNVWVQSLELPEVDVTANKIYTLSESSKVALNSLDQDVKIYVFGFKEDDTLVGLIKQYCEANNKISYEMLSSESNLQKVKEFDLEDGYKIVVIESGDSHKIIDTSSEFTTYDYSSNSEVDTTEQTLTNSILSLSTANKPKVYFVQGHEEFSIAANTTENSQANNKSELGVLSTYLNNEAYDVKTIDLSVDGKIPDDCNVLAIMSPKKDYLENEAQSVIDYINKGGNVLLTKDIDTEKTDLTNFNNILNQYGVSIENGYVVETDTKNTNTNYPYIFRPQLSTSNEITSEISSDSYMWLAYAQRLKFADNLDSLKVKYEPLLETSDTAKYITDFNSDVANAIVNAESGKSTIAALVTKTINEGTKEDKSDAVESKLVISGNGVFISDYIVSGLSNSYPISYMGSNKDFVINAISSLADKKDGLTIRKDMAGTSYVFSATKKQNIIVLVIIFVVPILILIIGIIVGRHRKKRK